MSDPPSEALRQWLAEAQQLQALGEHAMANVLFERVLSVRPQHTEARNGRARSAEVLRSPTVVVEAIRRQRVDSVPRLLQEGDALRQAGCLLAAMAPFSNVLRQSPERAEALYGLGACLSHLGQVDEAVVLLQRAASLLPRTTAPLRELASVLTALNRLDEAEACWRDYLAREPAAPVALAGLDLLRERRKRTLDRVPSATLPHGARRELAEQLEWLAALRREGREGEGSLPPGVPLRALQGATLALEDLTRWDAAAEGWRRQVLLDPQRTEAVVSWAACLQRAGRQDEALRELDQALSLRPQDPALMLGRAAALLAFSRHQEALETYDLVLRSAPSRVEALIGRAQALEASERPAEALAAWQAVLAREPENRQARASAARLRPNLGPPSAEDEDELERAGQLANQGRRPEAQELLEVLLRRKPRFTRAWLQLARIHLELQAPAAARAALARAKELGQSPLDLVLSVADQLRRKGEHELALALYDDASDANDPRVLAGRAEVLRQLGRPQEALTFFEAALAQVPQDPLSLAGKAAVLNTLRRYEEAQVAWEAALALQPHSVMLQRGMAVCRAGLQARARRPPPRRREEVQVTRERTRALVAVEEGREHYRERRYAEAAASFLRALEEDPTFAEAALRLGIALEDGQRNQEAIDAYKRCLLIDPRNHQAASNIGEVYRKSNWLDEAIRAYDRALEIQPNYLYALAGRAECMRLTQRAEESLAWFDRALAAGPRHVFALQGKAAALNSLQRWAEARPLWEKALEIDPTSAFAQEGKAACEREVKRGGEHTSETQEREQATPTLDELARDLTALAKKGALPPVIGREAEIRAVLKTLVRKTKANPLLLGPPGVGKTAIVEGVAQLLASDKAPPRLQNRRILELSLGGLVAGTKYRGTFEERLREIVKEATRTPGIILFIDEIHTLVGAGRTEGGSLDAANLLKPALARGEITLIGATTEAEFRKHLAPDAALERRFQPINVTEPTPEQALVLLQRLAPHYEQHHQVKVDPQALARCIRLAIRYLPDRRLPDKAIDLLDEACAEASLSGEGVVTPRLVAAVVAERLGAPVEEPGAEERDRLARLQPRLERRVRGQNEAVRRLVQAVQVARTGFRDAHRPRGVFLFAGPSGVGKTELARALADELFPEGGALLRLDMAEYAERATASRLLGAPPGYVGHGEEGQLTGPLRRRPYQVVLLDEFEKAAPEVQTTFLALFDQGTVTDAQGAKISAREAWFVLTTNAGVQEAERPRVGFGGSETEAEREGRLLEKLRSLFRPELINRLDAILPFRPLDDSALAEVAAQRLDRLAEQAAAVALTLTWEANVPSELAASAREPSGGARAVLRAVEDQVAGPLGALLLRAAEPPAEVHLTWNNGQISLFERPSRPASPAPRSQSLTRP